MVGREYGGQEAECEDSKILQFSRTMSLIHFLLNLEQKYQIQGHTTTTELLIYASNKHKAVFPNVF